MILMFLLGCAATATAFIFSDSFKPEPVQSPPKDIIARVGSLEIGVDDFRREAYRRGGAHPERIDKEILLDEMITDNVLLLNAIDSGLDKNPEIERAYRRMLVRELKQRHLVPRIKNASVTDAEVRDYYEAHANRFTRPAKIRLAMIYMAIPPASSEETVRSQMAEVRAKAIAAPEDNGFGKWAVLYSHDQTTRYKGGDIGWVEEGKAYRWDPVMISTGLSLENIGDVSDIITGGDGVYMVKLTDRRPAGFIPFEKAAPKIRYQLKQKKERDIEDDFNEERRAAADIHIYSEVLESVTLPEPFDSGENSQRPPKTPH